MTERIPWDYIKLNQLMSSVKADLSSFDEANLVDEDRVIKIVSECNEKLGQRIYKSKQCKIIVENGKAPMPSDLWKIETIFGLSTSPVANYAIGVPGATQVVYTEYAPPKILSGDVLVPVYCKKDTICCGGRMIYLSEKQKQNIEVSTSSLIPLTLSTTSLGRCANYSPCSLWKGQYDVNIEDEEFVFSFKEGEIYISYLGNMTDEDGELIIPFHPLLNQYYELSVMKKILQDIYLNSEADVAQRLQYVSQEQSKAYFDAYSFVQTATAGQWAKMRKQREMEFYHKWYSIFN